MAHGLGQRPVQQGIGVFVRVTAGCCRADHQHDFTAWRAFGFVMGGEVRQGAATGFLEFLGELAGDRGLPRAETGGKRAQGLRQALGGLEDDKGCGNFGKGGDGLVARARFWGQEALEEKAVCRQACDAQRGEDRGRAGQGRHRMAFGNHVAHQLVARVGHKRRARIADEENGRAVRQPRQHARAHALSIVLVIALEAGGQAMDRKQLAGLAGIFAEHEISRRKGVEQAQAHILRVADRRCGNVQTRTQGRAQAAA